VSHFICWPATGPSLKYLSLRLRSSLISMPEQNCCGHCGASHASKNKLFKHLSDSACTEKALASGLRVKPKPEKVVLLVGCAQSLGEEVVDRALWTAIDSARGVASREPSAEKPQVDRSAKGKKPSYLEHGHAPGFTCSSRAQFRCRQFRQDPGVRGVCDLVSFNTEKVYGAAAPEAFVEQINAALPSDLGMQVFGRLSVSKEFHAERDCDRRRYECLVPLSVLLPAPAHEQHGTRMPKLQSQLAAALAASPPVDFTQADDRPKKRNNSSKGKEGKEGKEGKKGKEKRGRGDDARSGDGKKKQKKEKQQQQQQQQQQQKGEKMQQHGQVSSQKRDDASMDCDDERDDEDEAMDDATGKQHTAERKQRQPGWTEGDSANSSDLKLNNSKSITVSERLEIFRRLKRALRHLAGMHHFHNFSIDSIASSDSVAVRMVYRCVSKQQLTLTVSKEPGTDQGAEGGTAAGASESCAFVVLSVQGQSFLCQQVRRMIGLLVAVVRGQLPEEAIQVALHPHCVMDIPPAPAHLFMLAGCQFHDYENKARVQVVPRPPLADDPPAPASDDSGGATTAAAASSDVKPETGAGAGALGAPGAKRRRGGNNANCTSGFLDSVFSERVESFRQQVFEQVARIELKLVNEEGVGEVGKAGGTGDDTTHADDARTVTEAWLDQALAKAVPGMLQQLSNAAQLLLATAKPELQANSGMLGAGSAGVVAKPAPVEFTEVLRLLRQAETSGLWPMTSTNRRRVIENSEKGGGKEGEKEDEKEGENKSIADAATADSAASGATASKAVRASTSSTRADSFSFGAMPPPLKQPGANKTFPELLLALYRLERCLCPERPPSSTIAVNKHAQFKPHKDTGAGAGQSTSLIVGLGDFSGGEIVVEGVAHDIRYKALQFNGWTQVHWTMPFVGERYSLVWFTPLGCEDMVPQLLPPAPPRALTASTAPAWAVSLANGVPLPRLGFGTFKMNVSAAPPQDAHPAAVAMSARCSSGADGGDGAGAGGWAYKLLDCGLGYKNQRSIASVVAEAGAGAGRKGDSIFVTTKIYMEAKGVSDQEDFDEEQVASAAAAQAFASGLQARLELSQLLGRSVPSEGVSPMQEGVSPLQRPPDGMRPLDLLLIHWPGLRGVEHASALHRSCRRGAWAGLQALYDQGYCRAIGVCNFTQTHLEELAAGAVMAPHVNQVEVQPMMQQRQLQQYCAAHSIQLQAFGVLGHQTKELLEHPTVLMVAKEAGGTPAQVLIQWARQHRLPLLVSSSSRAHIEENADLSEAELSNEHMGALDELESGKRLAWDPSLVK
jgi:tRNA pseudouridine(38-40) synthase